MRAAEHVATTLGRHDWWLGFLLRNENAGGFR